MKTTKIVVVDDDLLLLDELEKLLKAEGFSDVHFFALPSLALEFLKDNKPHLIISDFQMPEMDGVNFLTLTRTLCPNAKRILHTSHAGREDIIRAINEAGICAYAEKKWDSYSREWDFRELAGLITLCNREIKWTKNY